MPTRREGGADVPTIEPGPAGSPARRISRRASRQTKRPVAGLPDGSDRIGWAGRVGSLGPVGAQLAAGGFPALRVTAVVMLGSNVRIPDVHPVVVLGRGGCTGPTD